MSTKAALGAFSHTTIGVTDLAQAMAFWRDNFGFEATARREGPDGALATLWGLQARDIRSQALMAMPGARAGAMHLVEFAKPGNPVRLNAQVYDHLPKNLDLYTDDLDLRCGELSDKGIRFRTQPVTSPGPDGLVFREVHLPGPDETNIVLLQIIGQGYDTRFSRLGFAGIGPLITIVGNLEQEGNFYQNVLGMDVTLDIRLGGPAMKQMLGLPEGAALKVQVYGDRTEMLGRIEVIEYEQTRGTNLFARARAPALGTLHVTYNVADLSGVQSRLQAAGVPVTEHGHQRLLYGSGPVISCESPAGFRLEIQELA